MEALESADKTDTECSGIGEMKFSIFRSKRILLFSILNLVLFTVSLLRTNTSIALICMTLQEGNSTVESSSYAENEGRLNWDRNLVGYVLSSYYFGYITTQILSGYLSTRYGSKIVVQCSLMVAGLATVVSPWLAYWSPYLFIMDRILIGISSGFILPAISLQIAAWAPIRERSQLIVFTLTGIELGVAASMSISGYICRIPWLAGWPFIFYIHGSICLLVWFLYNTCCYNNPQEHPTITIKEQQYIGNTISSNTKKFSTPWSHIFTSMPFWAILIAHTCNNWGYYTMISCIPLFISDIFNVNLKDNGLLSAAPFFCSSIMAVLTSPIADGLRNSGYLSTKNTRKLFQTSSLILPAICLIVLTYVGQNVAAILLVLGVSTLGLSKSGFSCNHVDIAPRYAGILMGLTNTAATVPGIVAPAFTAYMTPNGSLEEWRMVFYIASGVFIFGAIFFLVFADGEYQKWSNSIEPSDLDVYIDKNNVITMKKRP